LKLFTETNIAKLFVVRRNTAHSKTLHAMPGSDWLS
jgi:hypothetical protein